MIFHVLDVELPQSGDGIVIGKVERFAAEVLPKYYKHSNYQSFVRQVCRWTIGMPSSCSAPYCFAWRRVAVADNGGLWVLALSGEGGIQCFQ